MWISAGCSALRASRFFWSSFCCPATATPASAILSPTLLLTRRRLRMEGNSSFTNRSSSSSSSSSSSRNLSPSDSASTLFRRGGRGAGGRGKEWESGAGGDRRRGRGGGDDTIDALGRLLTRILRHMASELNLDMRTDGYIRVHDLLRLNMTTYAKVPLRSHTVDDIKEAVRRDNKQRFSLLEENGELMIRANQGHTISCVYMEPTRKIWNQSCSLVSSAWQGYMFTSQVACQLMGK